MEKMAHAKSSVQNEISPSNLIEEKVESYFENKGNSNVIIDLFQLLLSDIEDTVVSSILGLEKIFDKAVCDGLVSYNQNNVGNIDSSLEEKLKIWHQQRFEETVEELLHLMRQESRIIKEQAFVTLFNLWRKIHEITNATKNQKGSDYFEKVVRNLLDEENSMRHVILKYDDFKSNRIINFLTLKTILVVLKEKRKSGTNVVFLENVFVLLQSFSAALEEDETQSQIKKKFSFAWIEFLKFKLPPILYKKVLIIIHNRIMPFMTNPLLLTDFLTDSYNIGGVISLLALNGLFLLIQKYNLEYPDFYSKLYALLTDVIFSAKYRARFFYLTDLFLSSTHIPAYLVAAFVKRLARLSLKAPVDALFTLIPFIGNLLIRHPSLMVLIDRPNPDCVSEDPYLLEEMDPNLCHAIDSSLWEIKSLQNHWHPEVSKKAAFINKALPRMEWDLADVLEIRHNDLFDKEIQSFNEVEEIPLSYYKPSALLKRKEDEMDFLWTT